MNEYHGHMTQTDGKHVALSKEEAERIWREIERENERRRIEMPTSHHALQTMFRAYARLEDMGWRRGMYCPKDGAEFACITLGSTGIFTAFYSGEWPTGYLHIEDEIGGVDGMMWKPIAELTEEEERARQQSAKATSEFIERLGQMAD